MKYDVVVIGELNVDIIFNKVQALPEVGKEKLAQQMMVTLGSSSAIFANNVSSLGAKVAFIGKVGKDAFGDYVLKALTSSGVDVSMVTQTEKASTGATVIMNFGEDRANLTYPGAMDSFSIENIPLEKLKLARHLHISSYFLQPGLRKHIGMLFSEAKKLGMTTSFDPQWDPYERWDLDFENILPFVDILLPNESELLKFTSKSSLEEAIETLKQYIHILLVKRGNKGSVAVSNGNIISRPAYLNEEVVDAIGAGDSFNAGFIFKFLQNAPLEICHEFGNLTGYISTTACGGIEAFISNDDFVQSAQKRFGL
ncbi:MAG: carbohydrate kinase family protein [Chitinophagaceae bacterium]|nr:carbohydrate kinase family protein [Chitinophagaceae bacterium]